MKTIFAFLLSLIFIPSFSQNSRVETLLRQIDSVYANAKTYRDHGEVSYSFKGLFLPNKREERFKTVFERNRVFRFSYFTRFEPLSFYGFQWDSTGTIHGYSFMKSWTRKDGDYNSCVAAAAGVSMCSSQTVPRLLMPLQVSGRHLLRGNGEMKLFGMDTLDGQTCYVLHNGDSIRTGMKIWLDADSLLIRQFTNPHNNSITRYYPEINRPIPAKDLIFKGRKEFLAVFGRNAPGEYFILISALIFLIIFGISRLIRRRQAKRGIEPVILKVSRFPKLKKAAGQLFFAILIASMFFNLISDPDGFLVIVLVIALLALVMLGIHYLSFPDWFYRHHSLYLNLIFVLFCLGSTLWIFSKIQGEGITGMGAWMIGIVPIMLLYITFAVWVHRRKWKRLRALTPCAGEEPDSLSAGAWLVYSEDEEKDDTNTGRIVLFQDRIVFAAEDGTAMPILFSSIQKISVHREWRMVPAGLKLTDFSGGMSYLLVGMPYYWKGKMEGRRQRAEGKN